MSLFLIVAALVGWYAYDLPSIDKVNAPPRKPSVTVTAIDGSVIATYGDLFAGPVHINDLPDHLVKAIMAAEDHRFFEHSGVDPIGILRAAYVNLKAGSVRQGGSTITQQLAKNLFLTPDRTLRRKVQEFFLALQLEARYTKVQLFTVYVNRVYFGAGTYGVEAASRRYFGVPARELTVHESAVLAGLIKAPSRYAPTHNAEGAKARARVVLKRMVAEEYLSPEQADSAAEVPLRLAGNVGAGSGRYFTDWVLERASGFVTQATRSLVIRTTLDPGYQAAAERRLVAALDAIGETRSVSQGAVLALSPDGAVRAMVGGRDYRKSQFNRTTKALRQPGSAFKPFVYLTAIEAGATPNDTMNDAPIRIDKWEPRNHDGEYRGTVTLRQAFASSINSVAVQVSENVGREEVIETARRLGITTPLKSHPSLALGANEVTLLELTAAYGVMANGGMRVVPYGIVEIRDSFGEVLFSRAALEPEPERVIEPEHVDALREMMVAAVREGTGRRAALARPVAGKTGTSQEFRDAWFVGYTPELVAGVWVGNDDGTPMNRIGGGSLPTQIWRNFVADTPAGPAIAWEKTPERSLFSRVAGAFRGLFGSSEPETETRSRAPAPAQPVLVGAPQPAPQARQPAPQGIQRAPEQKPEPKPVPRRKRVVQEEVDGGDYQP